MYRRQLFRCNWDRAFVKFLIGWIIWDKWNQISSNQLICNSSRVVLTVLKWWKIVIMLLLNMEINRKHENVSNIPEKGTLRIDHQRRDWFSSHQTKWLSLINHLNFDTDNKKKQIDPTSNLVIGDSMSSKSSQKELFLSDEVTICLWK